MVSKTVPRQRETVLGEKEITEKWERISADVAEAFRMSEEEKLRFRDKNVAKLIGMLPFLAGCENAERTAVSHLSIYLLSVRETKPYFFPNEEDDTDLFERLRLGTQFKGGDEKILKKGMSLLALIMLNDYKRDIYVDEALGKHNPVAAGTWNYDKKKKELIGNIESVDCPEMDKILLMGPGTESYWGP